MNIFSWNCQGMYHVQDLTIPRLMDLRKKHFPKVMFLMETKHNRNVMVDLQVYLGYDRVFTVDPIGFSGWLALFWKISVGVDIKYFSKNLLDCQIQFGTLSFFVSCIYGEPVMKYRQRLWERISRIGVQRKGSWCLLEDFNDILHNGEKVGGPCRNEFSFELFVNMIKACHMVELSSHGNGFIWGGMRYKKWIQCKLDRSFGNKEWFQMFSVSNQVFLEKRGSDHRPILVKLLSSQDVYRGQFRFDKRMLHKPRVKENIKQAWNLSLPMENGSVSDRIRSCRVALSRWKRTNSINARDNIEQI